MTPINASALAFKTALGKTFHTIFKELQKNGCSYLSYVIIVDNQQAFRISSDEEWFYGVYIGENLIQFCPLRKLVLNSGIHFIPWDIITLNKTEASIFSARHDFRQFNGITIVNRIGKLKEVIGMATEDYKFHLGRSVIISPDIYSACFRRLRKQATIYANYLRKKSFCDAIE